jgi:VWFA-related protein
LFIIGRSGLKILHDFTTDPAVLAAALKKRPGDKQAVEEASQEAIPAGTDPMLAMLMKREIEAEQRMESFERRTAVILTMEAMQQIAQSCAGLPGRKAVLWASAGFPFSINEADMVINIAGVKGDSLADVSALYQKTWRDLNQAQVSVYPVDVRGLVVSNLPDVSIRNPNSNYYSHASWMQTETIGTFQAFAQATGGRAFYNTNDLATAFQRAADDNASYYVLSYYLARKDKKPGWHKLSVKVHHDGTHVRARTGFFLDKDNSQQTYKSELQIALTSPLEYTAIPITGEWQQAKAAPEPGKKQVIFILTMPANFAEIDETSNNHMQIEFAAVARTATGTAADETVKTMDAHLKPASVEQIRTHGLDYRGALTLPPGEYTVHFAVQDQLNGRVGSVTTPLKVEP